MKLLQLAIFTNNERSINIINKFLKLKKFNINKVFLLKSYHKFNSRITKKLNSKINFIKFGKFSDKKFKDIFFKSKLDFLIISGFPKLVSNKILKYPKYGSINLHAGKLPKYRGGSPLNWQIINGEKKIGISCIMPNSKLDQGNILAKDSFFLKKKEKINHAHIKANLLFPKLVIKSINKLLKGEKGIKQKSKNAKYFKQRNDGDGKIDLFKSVNNIYNFVRALSSPYPGAFLFYKKNKIRVYEVKIIKKKIKSKNIGQIINIKKNMPVITIKNGLVQILKHDFKKKFIINEYLT